MPVSPSRGRWKQRCNGSKFTRQEGTHTLPCKLFQEMATGGVCGWGDITPPHTRAVTESGGDQPVHVKSRGYPKVTWVDDPSPNSKGEHRHLGYCTDRIATEGGGSDHWNLPEDKCLHPQSRSSSRWDFHFHSYVLTIYVCLSWILELVVFYSLVRRGTYARLVYNWYQNIFHTIAVLIVFHAANEKKESDEKKIKTRQQIDRD